MKKKILVLFAHPAQHRSEVNAPLFKATCAIDGVTTVDLYQEYPTYQIDIDREQERLRSHDIVIFMFPLYWYSTPAILKEWQDLVLEYGFAYGQEGTSLHGKHFFCAVSAGGPEPVYQADGFNRFTVRELLHPLEQMAHLCGMSYLPPYLLHGARTALEENRIPQHISRFQQLLIALRDDRCDLTAAAEDAVSLNAYAAHLTAGVKP